MFTGLIEEVGIVVAIHERERGRRLSIAAKTVVAGTRPGDSMAINGVCQTVTERADDGFTVEAVGDTLTKTTVGQWRVGTRVNLERACQPLSRLGGHFVLGHVNGVALVTSWAPSGPAWMLKLQAPLSLERYLVAEGSVTVDGISLTVAETQAQGLRLSIIPHTRGSTTLADLRVGSAVNLEVDILAKYVEGLLKRSETDLSAEKLGGWGYR